MYHDDCSASLFLKLDLHDPDSFPVTDVVGACVFSLEAFSLRKT